jgi:transposase
MKQGRPCVVSMDVATDQLDLACRPEPRRGRAAHDSAGLAPGRAPLCQLKPALLVLEATGGGQYSLGAASAIAQLPCAVVNPRHVRDFAKATGPWAKPERSRPGAWRPSQQRGAPRRARSPTRRRRRVRRCGSDGAHAARGWSPSATVWRWPTRQSRTAWRTRVMIASA